MKFINRKFAWLVLSLIVLFAQANAQEKTFDEAILSESGKQAYQMLLKIKLFAIGGIGYGGETSEGEKAFDILLEDNEAVLAFKSLAKNASSESGLYGLLGLKINDCDCFEQELNNYKKSKISEENKERFSTQAGCSFYYADKSSDKEFVIDYIVSKGFENFRAIKIRQKKNRELIEKLNKENNGVKKNQ